MKNKPIVVIAPTEAEIGPFRRLAVPGIHLWITGVGTIGAALNTMQAIVKFDPRLIILGGIAGAYAGSGLAIGDTVLVGTETTADMGAFRGDGFHPKFGTRLTCPHTARYPLFPTVHSNSVNCAGAPFIRTDGIQIENMEGAGFFHACLITDTPFLELRTVSNIVGADRAEWDIEGAALALSGSLNLLIHEIEA
ncbi:MAG: hypothetical protein IJC16_05460 [Rikenellaceae bacterium]|nr:hypothetical protein [Rikenellaceae bacterium]